jgi:hypothetical protein
MPTKTKKRATVEQRIEAAICKVKNEGWAIAPRLWVTRPENGAWACCALGAVALAQDSTASAYEAECLAQEALGKDDDWVADFACGFDGEARAKEASTPAYKLGLKFRKKYIKGVR